MRVVERQIAGAFIFSKDGFILLGKNDKGGVYKDCWLVPGGGVEGSETHEEAVKREVAEEVGLDITDEAIRYVEGEFTGESEKVVDGETVLVRMQFHNFQIDMSHNADELKVEAGDGFVDVCWVQLSELKNKQLSPGVAEILSILGYTVNYGKN